jgi:hypothetical protein
LLRRRDPRLSEGYLWPTIFEMIAERHPEAAEICQRLSDPLPIGPVITPYLEFANRMAREGRVSRHPFATEPGVERLSAFLADRNEDGAAISAAASIPFLIADAREPLLDLAAAHADPLVRLEAAWAMAKLDSRNGHRRLVDFCRDPRFSKRAASYLEELGLAKLVPLESRTPGFQAMSEMCSWLAHPMEFARAPDQIAQYDMRELNWPPTGERHRLWLFQFSYDPSDVDTGSAGIGLVGSVTFALAETAPDLSPEDVYGLHCCWELQQANGPRAPDECSPAEGRRLIADLNPGFLPPDG